MRSHGRLLFLGALAELRNPGIHVPAGLAALLVGAYAWTLREAGVSMFVPIAGRLAQGYGLAACLWFAYRAVRDRDDRLGSVLRSKPVDGWRWVLTQWASGILLWLALLLAPLLAAGLVAATGTAGLTGLGAAFLAYGHAAATVAIASTLSFALSRLMTSPLGGILILVGWVCVIAGIQYVPAYLRPEYSQNHALYVLAALTLLTTSGLLVERFRRSELRRPLVPVLVPLALLAGSVAGAESARRVAPGVDTTDDDTIYGAISQQHLEIGQRAPGFWLPDGKGGRVRLAAYPGKILVLYLFAAEDMEAAQTLRAMEVLRKKYADRGVQPIAICLSQDHADGRLLAQAGGFGFPIASDQSTLRIADPPSSAIATAWDTTQVPMLVVTDRRRRVRMTNTDPVQDIDTLRRAIEERLQEEPQ